MSEVMWVVGCFYLVVEKMYVAPVACLCFFKQKTAYEMRISDWSSDVCSSDLLKLTKRGPSGPGSRKSTSMTRMPASLPSTAAKYSWLARLRITPDPSCATCPRNRAAMRSPHQSVSLLWRGAQRVPIRSEEHTSELQSLMRTSNAVFGLKKK